ncbi:MAG TPA: hypothetical protein VK745_32220 [Polyangiaceae bacterium]|nr:hypothetical protein [Polyangiaceae bacterium]
MPGLWPDFRRRAKRPRMLSSSPDYLGAWALSGYLHPASPTGNPPAHRAPSRKQHSVLEAASSAPASSPALELPAPAVQPGEPFLFQI